MVREEAQEIMNLLFREVAPTRGAEPAVTSLSSISHSSSSAGHRSMEGMGNVTFDKQKKTGWLDKIKSGAVTSVQWVANLKKDEDEDFDPNVHWYATPPYNNGPSLC
jgi:hypothetical protein